MHIFKVVLYKYILFFKVFPPFVTVLLKSAGSTKEILMPMTSYNFIMQNYTNKYHMDPFDLEKGPSGSIVALNNIGL